MLCVELVITVAEGRREPERLANADAGGGRRQPVAVALTVTSPAARPLIFGCVFGTF